ncbi:hypothetical protein B484DRAFT_166509 [Ochromonadaceae sp. CCMP2298]|nr:hypothetical protein B484DRAFT_166509 [Ochromonadaceae sp. CCMP2298]
MYIFFCFLCVLLSTQCGGLEKTDTGAGTSSTEYAVCRLCGLIQICGSITHSMPAIERISSWYPSSRGNSLSVTALHSRGRSSEMLMNSHKYRSSWKSASREEKVQPSLPTLRVGVCVFVCGGAGVYVVCR